MTEKKKPHYQLKAAKELILAGKVEITGTAVNDGNDLGFSRADILEAVLSLEPREFYKSMTSKYDHRIWQDVYLPRRRDIQFYLKISVIEKLLIVFFKEK